MSGCSNGTLDLSRTSPPELDVYALRMTQLQRLRCSAGAPCAGFSNSFDQSPVVAAESGGEAEDEQIRFGRGLGRCSRT